MSGGADPLGKWSSPDWDEPTREAVRRRVDAVPPIRFFEPDEVRTLGAVCRRLVPRRGDDVPIVPFIDEKLHEDRRHGYRYAELPPQREAWRLGLQGIEEAACILAGGPFTSLTALRQDAVLQAVQRGDAPGSVWEHLPPIRFFRDVLLLTVVRVYFAHPTVWSEIRYSGPSSPRGHVRKGEGRADPWEAAE